MTILAALIAMAFGGISGHLVTKQTAYCECFRSDFDGKYCQSIKGTQVQGSCEGKK